MIGLADCSNGRRMLTPKLRSRPGAALAGFHDAAAGAGDDHEASLGDAPRKFLARPERGVGLLRARRAEVS